MDAIRRRRRLIAVGGALLAGVACAAAACYLRPSDTYLLRNWERTLSHVADEEVKVRLEQIAAVGEPSFPTLVAALHGERQIVAEAAADVLQREMQKLELRSTKDTSPIIARLAGELANRSDNPGPYAGAASTRLATRILLWPVDRKLIDGERLVADCESILRSAKPSPRGPIADQSLHRAKPGGLVSSADEVGSADLLTPVAGGGLPDVPPLPPQVQRDFPQSTEPDPFVPLSTSRALDTRTSDAVDEGASEPVVEPSSSDSRRSLDLRRDIASAKRPTTAGQSVGGLADLDVIRNLASADDAVARDALDELYRRGFQTKHIRLAELLVDPDPNVRLQMVHSVPQMSGVDSRPWLLWLSRDLDPVVRKAAIAVLATSTEPAFRQRVRELEREETDDEVLKVVRQILNNQPNAIR